MTDTARIREICERNVRILTLKPDKGHLTCATRARVEDGLRCSIEEGSWTLSADMPGKAGGDESAPTPGMLGRGALASCLAMGIVMWAARMNIPVDAVDVEIEADFDARGELGMDEAPVGYSELRRSISIQSSADEAALLELVDTAERYSPYLNVFASAQSMQRSLRLNGKEAES